MRKLFAYILLILLTNFEMVAETRLHKILNWIDSADVAGADTSYVRWPQQGFIASLNSNFVKSRLFIDFNKPAEGKELEYDGNISSRLTTLFSVGLSYRGWGLSYSRDFSEHKDEEFSFSTYGQTYGAEFHVRNSSSFTGTLTNVENPDHSIEVHPDEIRQHLITGNVYYVFNHTQFSLPAALSQTVIQRRSAGSWLALLSFYRSVLNFQDSNFSKLSTTQLSVGGGYAYNLVFNRERCLLHTSLMPSMMVYYHNRIFTPTEKMAISQNVSVDGVVHISFVYTPTRYLFGCSSFYNVAWSNLTQDLSMVDLNWSARVFIGVRF